MTVDSHTLVVMRHAKTETYAGSDRARELTARGVADSRAAGRWLRAEGLAPDLVLVSTAVRARQTVEHVAEALGRQVRVEALDDLYAADVDDVLGICGRITAGAGTVIIVGHNPTMADVVHTLLGDADEREVAHLATAGLAVVELPGEWADIAPGTGRLVSSHVARG